MSNPSCIRRRNTKAAVIGNTVEGSFHILVYHVETAVVLIDCGRVIFLAAAYHDVCTCSQFYGPAFSSAPSALVVDIVVH